MIGSRLALQICCGLILGSILLAGLSLIFQPGGSLDAWWSDYLVSVSSGLLGAAITFVAVSVVYERQIKRGEEQFARRERAQELLTSAKGSVGMQKSVIVTLRDLELLTDGSVAGLSLAGLDLRNCDFDGADLRGCDFSDADLRAATFIGTNVDRARFVGSNLTDALLEFASADGADFRDAIV